jgi:hypothetical protein
MRNGGFHQVFDGTSRWKFTHNGPWMTATSFKEGTNFTNTVLPHPEEWQFSLDFSLCSNALNYVKSVQVQAHGPTSMDEPTSMPDGIVQIGATFPRESVSERGILRLNETFLRAQLDKERSIIMSNTSLVRPIYPYSYVFTPTRFGPAIGQRDQGLVLPDKQRNWFPTTLAPACDPILNSNEECLSGVSEERVNLFQHVIRQTKSPALAMQSMMHTMISDRYYKYMPYYQNQSTQVTTSFASAVRPVRTRGYIVVMVGIASHLLLVGYICVVLGGINGFKETLRSTDQAWQAHAQVLLLAEQTISDVSLTSCTDREVEKITRRRGLGGKVFRLRKGEDGAPRFVAKERTEESGKGR